MIFQTRPSCNIAENNKESLVNGNMNIIDLHCDTVLNCLRDSAYFLLDNPGHINLQKMKKGGALAQFFAIFISRREMETMSPYEIFSKAHDVYDQQLKANTDLILPATCVEDVLENKAQGKISAILAIEDGVAAEGKMERLVEFFNKGVRLVTLTWNFENEIGFPCNSEAEAHKLGLKPFGFEVVEKMNELGMLIDVSHLSEGGFYDVARHSKKPFVASHSCARALCDHRRNLTDDQLRVLGEKGGVVGVNFYSTFLKDGSESTFIDDIVAHTVYMAGKAGVESIGFGSDFDGIDCELDMKDYEGYPLLLDALHKHFTASEMDKICNGNVMRLMAETLKKA